MDTHLVLPAQATLGEAPLWHAREQRLLWVDIEAGTLHRFDPADGSDRALAISQPIGAVVPRRSGGVMLALEQGFAAFDPDTGALTLLADPEADRPDNRFNDGKCDPAGRFWAGTINRHREPRTAALYCLDTDLTVRRMLGGLTNSNGLCWSLDQQTFYHIDTPTRQVSAFDYRVETGRIRNRRTVVSIPPEMGKPDGMTIDTEGMLWIALFRGGCVGRWNPRDGRLLQTVSVPASQVTACAFGGAELATLYITTARAGLDEAALADQPDAGGLFAARPGVAGVEAFEFAG